MGATRSDPALAARTEPSYTREVATAVRLGSHMGDYRVEGPLRRTPAGIVYRARDQQGRDVALEVLGEEVARSSGLREGLQAVSEQIASLEQPNLLTPDRVEAHDDGLCLVYEDPEGINLSALLTGVGALSYARAAGLVAQIAAALEAAHGAGLAHGNVHPAYVLVSRAGGEDRAALAGFGLPPARSPYTAPEVSPASDPDSAADVFGLTAILYHALVGPPPFGPEGMGRADRAAPPSGAVPELPAGIDEVIFQG